MDERTGDRHPLLLTTRHLVWSMVGAPGHPNGLEHLVDLAPRIATPGSAEAQRHVDVLPRGGEREEAGGLEDEAELGAPEASRGGLRQVVDAFVVDPHLPGVGPLEEADHVELGGLAGTGRSEECDELAVTDGEIHLACADGPVRVRLGDVAQLKAHRVPPVRAAGPRERPSP